MNGLPKKWPDGFGDFQKLQRELEADGWCSPDTYAREFDSAGDFPAVYLFTLVDTYDYLSGFVAYVGQSSRLASRWSGHSILRELAIQDGWVKRWFFRCDEENLRSLEDDLIKKFDPPWNIQGRPRGVQIHG